MTPTESALLDAFDTLAVLDRIRLMKLFRAYQDAEVRREARERAEILANALRCIDRFASDVRPASTGTDLAPVLQASLDQLKKKRSA